MINEGEKKSFQAQEDENVTTVMAYTQSLFIWGDIITKKAVRVSTWLRTSSLPEFIFFHNAQLMVVGDKPRIQAFHELHLPSSQIIAFHIKPPAHDPLDYDPNEKMRKMVPTTALAGMFHFNGMLRMSDQTTMDRFLDVAKEVFTSMYEVEITQPTSSAMGVIRAPFVLLRSDSVLFSPRIL